MPPFCFSVDFVLNCHWLSECRASPNALARICSRHAAPMGLVDSAGGHCVAEAASGGLTSIHPMCVDRQLMSRSARLWLVNAASLTESDIQSIPSRSIKIVWDHAIGRLCFANINSPTPLSVLVPAAVSLGARVTREEADDLSLVAAVNGTGGLGGRWTEPGQVVVEPRPRQGGCLALPRKVRQSPLTRHRSECLAWPALALCCIDGPPRGRSTEPKAGCGGRGAGGLLSVLVATHDARPLHSATAMLSFRCCTRGRTKTPPASAIPCCWRGRARASSIISLACRYPAFTLLALPQPSG